MPWKIITIGEGEKAKELIEKDDNGNPIWVSDDEREDGVDWPAAQKRIGKFVDTEKKLRKQLKESDEGYSAFREKYKDIENPDAAIEALKKVQTLKDKKMVDSGEAEKLRKQIVDEYERKIGETRTEYDKRIKEFEDKIIEKDSTIRKQMVTNKFADSKYIRENLIIPPDMAELKFGEFIKIEDNQIVGYHMSGTQKGDKILSKANPGELADFNEIIQTLVDEYERKEDIKRGTNQSGGGSHGSDSSGATKKYETLNDFGSIAEKVEFMGKNPQEWQKIVERSTKKK